MRYNIKQPKQKKMDRIMSKCLNSEYKDEDDYKKKSKKVLQELTEMGVFR